MRGLALAAALCCASQGVLAQAEPPRKPAAARSAPAKAGDDARSRQLLKEAEGAFAAGDYAAAEGASLRLLQENIRVFGPDHPNVATALSLLGAAHLRQGKFNEAEGDFRRMLTIYEKRLGPDHEYTAAALNSLALVLEQLGDYKGAEALLRRSLAISEKRLGKNHPDTATTLSNLSRVLDNQGKFAGGETEQIAARAETALRRGQYDEAETLHHQVLAIHLRTLGPAHPTTANSMSNLGRVLDLQGKYAEAEK
ncbi:MAG TPA: tetratricopeptide repeat protein, partial [Burkholderiales bacterium]